MMRLLRALGVVFVGLVLLSLGLNLWQGSAVFFLVMVALSVASLSAAVTDWRFFKPMRRHRRAWALLSFVWLACIESEEALKIDHSHMDQAEVLELGASLERFLNASGPPPGPIEPEAAAIRRFIGHPWRLKQIAGASGIHTGIQTFLKLTRGSTEILVVRIGNRPRPVIEGLVYENARVRVISNSYDIERGRSKGLYRAFETTRWRVALIMIGGLCSMLAICVRDPSP